MVLVNQPIENLIIMSFKDWTLQNLEDTFLLEATENCEQLTDWLNMPYDIRQEEETQLEQLQKGLKKFALHWNEQEWKMKFISLLLNMVNYSHKTYNIFYERTLQGEVKGYLLKGKVDSLIAQGQYEPKMPYFCFHEYKKEKGTADDPLAQLLSAMLVAQVLNENQQPIYGCYVIGRNWFFVTLIEHTYCVSNNYSVTQKDELQKVYTILINLKTIIEHQLD